MARKTKITKDIILQAALRMLIRDGYSSINIKTLAKEIGCSTQPIVWHFEDMEGLRTALAEYVREYANRKMCPTGDNAIAAFEQIGRGFVEIAVKEPNLFRFLNLNEKKGPSENSFGAIVANENNAEMIKSIAGYLGIAEDKAGDYLQNTMIYAHGIATLVATDVIKATEEEMMTMINQAADAFLRQAGVDADKIM